MRVERAGQLVGLLQSYRFNFTNERELQDGIAGVLNSSGIEFERELRLNARDRIDFLAGDVGIEVKVAGSSADLLRQLSRYAQHPRIASLIVVTNKSRLACVGQAVFANKRVSAVVTSRSAF